MTMNPFTEYFEFIAPYSVERCQELLERKSKRRPGLLSSRRQLQVKVSQTTTGSRFQLDQNMWRGVYSEVIGDLQSHSQDSTLVKGDGRVSLWGLALDGLVLIFALAVA